MRPLTGAPHPNYSLHYCAVNGACFDVQSIWDAGSGGECKGKRVRELVGRSVHFGTLHVCANGSPPSATWYAWLDGDAAMLAWLRSRSRPPQRARFYEFTFTGTGMSDHEAVAIVESLTPLR